MKQVFDHTRMIQELKDEARLMDRLIENFKMTEDLTTTDSYLYDVVSRRIEGQLRTLRRLVSTHLSKRSKISKPKLQSKRRSM